MKLNLGCGFNKRDGYINVDMSPECSPDALMDLESTPWIWETNSVDEVLFNHSLEHLGADPQVFLAIMKELYRVCRNDGVVQINAPHPRHDNYIGDPTHVRIITPQLLTLFSKRLNDEWKRGGFSNTPLAIYLDVDFEIETVFNCIEEPYLGLYQSRQLSDDQLALLIRERNNVVSEYRITLRVVK